MMLLALQRAPMTMRANPHMAVSAAPMTSYELCILGAKSEDDVAACMASFDETRYEASVAAGEGFDAVEECILQAKSEDEVQACMQMADAAVYSDFSIDVSPAATTLGDCLARADGTVEECVAEVESQSDEHMYG